LSSAGWALMLNALVAIVFFYLIPFFVIAPKTNLFINIVLVSIFFISWRSFIAKSIIKRASLNNVLYIGTENNRNYIQQKIDEHQIVGFQLAFSMTAGQIGQLAEIIKKNNIQTIVVDADIYPSISTALYELIPLNLDIFALPTFLEQLELAIPISETDKSWFLENLKNAKKTSFNILKRASDFVFSCIFGLISLFLYPFIAGLIKCSGSGKIFYAQQRVGKNNRLFKMYKFRTMIAEAEKNGAQWSVQDDERITWAGKFLRKTRLDELPQLWNILRGEMSFIGPRPERPEFVEKLNEVIPHYSLRHLIQPGLTGWAQINFPYGSSVEDSKKKLSYDLYYLKNRNLILDISIILKTIAIVLKFRGR
jgi:exopolysaccharide biosynthesis polyprenyl glycosylphosphotransferase